jgi:histidine ammonia-lyase
MTVTITGHALTRCDLVAIARQRTAVALDDAAREQMAATRAVVERALERGDPVYGLSTAVGVLKRVGVGSEEAGAYSRRMLRDHAAGQGPSADEALVRATMARLANLFAEGSTGVRPELAQRLVDALNAGETPAVRTRGSVGQGDLIPLADLALGAFEDVELEPGEGLALLGSNAFATAAATLAVDDAVALLDTLDASGALSLEGFGANLTILHPRVAEVRPHPGLVRSLARFRSLLAGSDLLSPGAARHLQDPLSFRNLPQLHGAARDALDHIDAVLAVELNAAQTNPLVIPDEDHVVSVANFEILPLAAALDYLRIVLASVVGAAAERVVKVLQTPWSDLPTGLATSAGTPDPGLSYLGIAVQSIAAEARLLAQPVSTVLISTAHAEGIEDRTTMAPLAARYLAEQVDLAMRVAAIELTVAAEAAERRGHRLGTQTSQVLASVRETIPPLAAGGQVPDVEPLVARARAGELRSTGAD